MLHSDNRTDHGRNFRSKWDGYKNNGIDGGILWEQCDVNNVKVGQDGMGWTATYSLYYLSYM